MLVGTSGYNYDTWKGRFYPEGLASKRWLSFYAGRFPTVEINYTFYRHPSAKTYEGWAAETPAGFTFALKASQAITHRARLKDAEERVRFFCDGTTALGDKRGPVLFGLPPNLKKDLPRLRAFLATLPTGLRAAFEFRHASWLDEETFAALREAGASLCVADSEDLETPCVATAPWGYLRLRRADYDAAALDRWAGLLRSTGWTEEVFVYFKHEDEARGPALADELRGKLGAVCA